MTVIEVVEPVVVDPVVVLVVVEVFVVAIAVVGSPISTGMLTIFLFSKQSCLVS